VAIDSFRRDVKHLSRLFAFIRGPYAFLLFLLGALIACHPPDLSDRTEEEPPWPASNLQVAEPDAAPQLISGWYNVEKNSWRWTAGKFAVILRPPIGSAVKGATLTLNFTVPEVIISRLRSVTLSASIEGTGLAPETYPSPGKAIFKRDVPARLLSGETVRVDFALNRVMVPGHGDNRELGVVVDRVGLEPK